VPEQNTAEPDPGGGDRADRGGLDQLSTDELRRRAFRIAEHRLDAGFFWDLLKHLPPSGELASEDASTGGITASVTELVELVRELFGDDLGAAEPLIRARFIDYISEHG
jgi:hypothetical protein